MFAARRQAGRFVIEGLKLFLPVGISALTRERTSHLHSGAAKWQLYELENREEILTEIDVSDRANVRTRLVHWTDEEAARVRFAEPIKRMQELMPEAAVAGLSAGEIAFRSETGLIFPAMLPAGGARRLAAPGGMRCDRPPARLRAERFGLLPRKSARASPSLDRPREPGRLSNLCGNP
jgi:hypothetical protein